jgi:hypothetical protein
MAKESSPKRSTGTAPFTWANIELLDRRLDTYGRDDPKKLRGVDRRLLTIAPAIESFVLGLKGYGETPAPRQAVILGIARRAVGTFEPKSPRDDMNRALVICDWMLRCALPIWLDPLPTWCRGKDAAEALRGLRAICWSHQIVLGISALSPAWAALRADYADRGTQRDREIVWQAADRATAAMRVLADALVISLDSVQSDRGQARLCKMAARLALSERGDENENAAVMKTVPALVGVLLDVQNGDSRSSVADRCVWTGRAKAVA